MIAPTQIPSKKIGTVSVFGEFDLADIGAYRDNKNLHSYRRISKKKSGDSVAQELKMLQKLSIPAKLADVGDNGIGMIYGPRIQVLGYLRKDVSAVKIPFERTFRNVASYREFDKVGYGISSAGRGRVFWLSGNKNTTICHS